MIINVPASNVIIPLNTEDISTAKICGWDIVGLSQGTDSLIGQSLLRNTYLTFDMETNQVSFSGASDTTTKVTIASQ